MSVAINLLPDIRQNRLRDAKRRRKALSIAVAVWTVSGAIVMLLFLLSAGQKIAINDATKKITDMQAKVESTDGLVDALTAQQHIATLPTVMEQKVYLSKFFEAFGEANPDAVKLNSLSVSDSNELAVSGVADSYSSVAKLAKALEFSNVTVGEGASTTNQPYFTDVRIESVAAVDKEFSFSIGAIISTEVFNADNNE